MFKSTIVTRDISLSDGLVVEALWTPIHSLSYCSIPLLTSCLQYSLSFASIFCFLLPKVGVYYTLLIFFTQICVSMLGFMPTPFPSHSSPYSYCFVRHVSSILMTWPLTPSYMAFVDSSFNAFTTIIIKNVKNSQGVFYLVFSELLCAL